MESRQERKLSSALLEIVRVGNFFETILEIIGGLAIVIFTGAVFLDVAARLLGTPLKSCQEIALFAFVWAIFTGSAIAVRCHSHFTIDIIVNSFKGVGKTVIDIFDYLCVCGFSVVLLIYGYQYCIKCLKRFSQPSGICMTVGTACMVVGAFCMIYYCIEYFILAAAKTDVDECKAAIKEGKK